MGSLRGAFACLAALAGLLAGLWLARPVSVTGDPLREQVAASHVASLTVNGRLTDVTVSDQHVIKPWFQGKVDFAPDVRDFSTEGFRLVGARPIMKRKRPALLPLVATV